MGGGDESRGTEHVRVPVPPGGDAGRQPGSPDLAKPDPEGEPAEGEESSGHPHSGRPHQVEPGEGLPGEWDRREVVSPPEDR